MHILLPVYSMGKWSGGYNLHSLNSGTKTSCEQSKARYISISTPMQSLVIPSVHCGTPVAPQRGSLENYTNTIEGAEVFYSCGQNSVPEGRIRAVCTRSGWSPNLADLSCAGGWTNIGW